MAELFDFMVSQIQNGCFDWTALLLRSNWRTATTHDAPFRISYDHRRLSFSNSSPSWPFRDSPFAADDPCATHKLVAVNS